MNREVSRKLLVLIGFLACSQYILEKLFSREPSSSIVLAQKISFTDEMFGSNLFLSDKIVDSRFCDCEDECFRDQWRKVSIMFVLHFEHVAFVFCRNPSRLYFRF